MIIINADVFTENNRFEDKAIVVHGHIITELIEDDLEMLKARYPDEEIIDASGCYAIPGLTDMHFHGCMGHDFCEGTNKALQAITAYEASQGVTTICPATMTLSKDMLLDVCKNAAKFSKEQQDASDAAADIFRDKAQLLGINLEGPFISLVKKGAQNPLYIHQADAEIYKELYKASNGLVKTIVVAPEEPGAMDFIDTVHEETVVSIAHTSANYAIAKEAIDKGAHHVTHLYNAMPAFMHRDPGVIGAACDNESCHVELICDGIHIHPSVVRTTFKMFGDDRIILISDSMEATGMPDGEYALGGLPVFVHGHYAKLKDGTLAGSATNLMDCLRTAVKDMGIPLESAVKCAAVNPAKEIGIYDHYGSISAGKVANIVLLDQNLDTKTVFLKGNAI